MVVKKELAEEEEEEAGGEALVKEGKKKTHNRIYNSIAYKDSGGEKLKWFEFNNTISNLADKFNKGMESITNYIEIDYNNSKDVVHYLNIRELFKIPVPTL